MKTQKVTVDFKLILERGFNLLTKDPVQVTYGNLLMSVGVVAAVGNKNDMEAHHVVFSDTGESKWKQKTEIKDSRVNDKWETVLRCQTELVLPLDVAQSEKVSFNPVLFFTHGSHLFFYHPTSMVTDIRKDKTYKGPTVSETENLDFHTCHMADNLGNFIVHVMPDVNEPEPSDEEAEFPDLISVEPEPKGPKVIAVPKEIAPEPEPEPEIGPETETEEESEEEAEEEAEKNEDFHDNTFNDDEKE